MAYKTVPLNESQVGKYVDIDGDGIPEGVIFADLAVGGEGQWGNEYFKEKYKIPTIEDGLKDYIVIGEYNDQINGKQEVVVPILDGEDRFYIMALSNVNKGKYSWYGCAKKMPDYKKTTLNVFGSGRQNTLNMMKKWTNEEYGKKKQDDLWNKVKIQVQNGWFIPSIDEWCAFTEQIGITESNYSSKGLSGWYWTSSQYNTTAAYLMNLNYGCVSNINVDYSNYVRLAATF